MTTSPSGLHHVVAVALVKVMGLERIVDQVRPFHVAGRVEALEPGDLLRLANSFVVHVAGALLFLDLEVDVPLERSSDPVGLGVLHHVVERRAGDDQRRAGLVDQDAVDLVDDRVIELALGLILLGRLHVVAQVVEAEFVVGAVGDIAAVHLLALGRIHLRLDRAHGHPEAVKERAHPLGVAAGQVVVDRHHVDALAVEGIQVCGQGGDQGLAFAGDHLGDVSAVQDHAAHQLDVEMPHVEIAAARLARSGERLDQKVFERLARGLRCREFLRLGPQLIGRERLHRRLELVDLGHRRPHMADSALVGAAEKPDQPLGYPLRQGRECIGRLVPNIAQQFHCPTDSAKVWRIDVVSRLANQSYIRPFLGRQADRAVSAGRVGSCTFLMGRPPERSSPVFRGSGCEAAVTRCRTCAASASRSRGEFPGSGRPRPGCPRIPRGWLAGSAARRAGGTVRRASHPPRRALETPAAPKSASSPPISLGFDAGAGSRVRRDRREVLGPDRLAAGDDGRVLDGVAQLADVAGPGPCRSSVEDVAGELSVRHGGQAGLSQEMLGQGRDVFPALAKGRNVDLEDAEAEEQVLAELTGRHQRAQRPVGRRDDPDVGGRGRASPTGVTSRCSMALSSLT